MRPYRSIGLVLGVAALLAAAGCGSVAHGGEGQATVVVSRPGGEVTRETVAAGQTALRALRSVADVKTRYGGRFVSAIDGLEGDTAGQRDWLYYVNGYLADRGAAEYRLRHGDRVEWLYVSWREQEQPVLVSGFPALFLHGYGGRRRASAVRYERGLELESVRHVAEVVGAGSVAPLGVQVSADENVLELVGERGVGVAAPRRPGTRPGSPVRFRLSLAAASAALEATPVP